MKLLCLHGQVSIVETGTNRNDYFKQIKRNSAVSLLAMNFLHLEKFRPMLVVILYFPHLSK